MYESELFLVVIIVAWILYEVYGSAWFLWLSTWSMYIRIVGGILVICWIYYQQPEQFMDTAVFAGQLLRDGSKNYVATRGGGGGNEKRNVTGLTKKKVAASQSWKCGNCNQTLDETYEVDHRLALYKGGSNDISNLVALCPHCHRKKTVDERLA
jgi:5-methylcytosine-specific restriction endonuclease McrA